MESRWARTLRFDKMHGTGNDFVVVLRDETDAEVEGGWPALAVSMCDRRTGVGADGLVVVSRCRPRGALAQALALGAGSESGAEQATMRIFNADGSEPEMCGNGLRVAVMLLQASVPDPSAECAEASWRVATGRGVLDCKVLRSETARPRLREVVVDMGPPLYVRGPETLWVNLETLEVAGSERAGWWRAEYVAVSMGNPHCVMFCRDRGDWETWPFERLGAAIEAAVGIFPARTNVEMVLIEDRLHCRQRTFERGVGETGSCGTGACATVVAGQHLGLLDRPVAGESPVEVSLTGGRLVIGRDNADGRVLMAGAAVHVFSGVWPLGSDMI